MTSTNLPELLHQLELAAAAVGRELQSADEATIEQALLAFAPLKPKTYGKDRWNRFWLEWLLQSADAWSAGEMPTCRNNDCD